MVKRCLSRMSGKLSCTVLRGDGGSNPLVLLDYSSKSFQVMLEKHNLVGSMSKPACPYDNACIESFFSSAKRECIYRKEYGNIEEVRADLFEYIELFYNRKRIHSSLGYMSPVEYWLSKKVEWGE